MSRPVTRRVYISDAATLQTAPSSVGDDEHDIRVDRLQLRPARGGPGRGRRGGFPGVRKARDPEAEELTIEQAAARPELRPHLERLLRIRMASVRALRRALATSRPRGARRGRRYLRCSACGHRSPDYRCESCGARCPLTRGTICYGSPWEGR